MKDNFSIEDALLAQNLHWRNEKFPFGVEREVKKNVEKFLNTKHILILTGVRRSGKSFVLFQLINDLLEKNKPENILFINFDDPSLIPLTTLDNPLEKVFRTYIKLKNPEGKKYIFFDEIQNLNNWEKWIKAIYDRELDIKIIITGSNATLLSAEMSTLLTARNIKFDVFPFDFEEFLLAKGCNVYSSDDIKKIYEENFTNRDTLHHFLFEFIEFGSFPEVVLIEDEDIKKTIIKTYYEDIIYKDIVPRFEIRHSDKLENLAYYLITNISNHFSFNSLGKVIGIHENTAKEFLSYFEKAYLNFSLSRYNYSTKKQLKSSKKSYCIDTGLRNALAFRFSEDMGRLAENLVYLKLKQMDKKFHYWKNKYEVDFLIIDGLKISNAIQVCWDLESNDKTKVREHSGLMEVLNEFNLNEGTIITRDHYGSEEIEGKKIYYIPLWVWLLVKE